jgi:hypothetical protein
VQHLTQRPASWQAGILHGQVETGDGPAVHLLVRAVAAVQPHHEALIAVAAGVDGGTAESLSPVGGQPLVVAGVESVAERMADHLIGHHPGMPGPGQAKQAHATARGFIHALHAPRMPGHPPHPAANRCRGDP